MRSVKDPPEKSADKGDKNRGKKATRNSASMVSGDMGTALRRIYDGTVEESVPDEMMSLLGKLT